MKVKLLRRVFCVVMCVVILACCSVNVFAVDWLNRPLKWSNSGSGHVNIYWADFDAPYSGIGVTHSKIASGAAMWVNGTSVISSRLYATEVSVSQLGTYSSGWIAFVMATPEYWSDVEFGLLSEEVFAVTNAYDSIGMPIEQSSSNLIAQSYIFYSPTHDTEDIDPEFVETPVSNWASIMAHEIGHSLGFGHTASSVESIMRKDIASLGYASLKLYDQGDFHRKYG